MPEGPEIHRAAAELHAALAGRRAERVWFARADLQRAGTGLEGRRIASVGARGKAILTRFDDGRVIYSHNQLYGRWQVSADGTRPESRRSLRLAIHTDGPAAFLFSASDIAVLDAAQLPDHPYLARLGPDLLDEAVDEATVLARLNEPRFARRGLVALLQDQRFLAGIGNYLAAEILHHCGIHPAARLQDLDDATRLRLAEACLALPRQSLATGGITNTLSRAAALQQKGADFETARFLVYRRAGLPCYRCGTPVEKARFVGKTTYWCPACQPPAR